MASAISHSKQMAFRRINGRIIPIRAKAAAAIGATAAGMVAAKSRQTPSSDRHLSSTYKWAGYGTQVLSGLVAAMPTKTKLGAVASIGASVGLDLLSATLQARSASFARGSKYQKATLFAQQQAVGESIGYATFGAGWLASGKTRAWLTSHAKRGMNLFKKGISNV